MFRSNFKLFGYKSAMRRILKLVLLLVVLVLIVLFAYGGKGYWDATQNAASLRTRADTLIVQGHGGGNLGAGRLDQLLLVQDPAFYTHAGVDLTTTGAGATTITQSLSKRLAFSDFKPGFGKIRQTGYAFGLEHTLTKDQILAIWLDTVEMGQGPDDWMTGFFNASEALYDAPPAEISDRQFLGLIAVMIAPSRYDLQRPDAALLTRIDRIERLIAGQCSPSGHHDVWLEGCESGAL